MTATNPTARSRRALLAPLLSGALLVALRLSSLAGPASAADPFYLELLRDGSRALQTGEHAKASGLLRLACFGLLEEPKTLAECLVQLSLAQAALDQRSEFEETFIRISALEGRFEAYSAAELPAELVDAFADRAVTWIPAVDLEAIPSLAAAYDRRLEGEVMGLPPAQRRQRLAGLQAADPGDPRWPRLLAELELGEGNPAAAAAAAAVVLQLEPADRGSRCIQGRARAAEGQCQQALIDLAACTGTTGENEATIERVDCLSTLSRWEEAGALLSSIPPELLQQARVRRLANRVEKERAKLEGQENRPQQAAAEQRRAERQTARLEPQRGRAQQQAQQTAGTLSAEFAAAPTPAGASPTAPSEPSASASAVPDSGDDDEGQDPGAGNGEGASASPIPTPARSSLSASESAALDRARTLARSATLSTDLAEPMHLAQPIADRHPEHRGAQHLVAEIAYRASDWQTAVRYFDRGGDPRSDEPILLFYQAIALYENGDGARAEQAMRRSLDGLERDPWVDSYVEKILGPTGSL
ncbi:MAG TPA: hypothetical protein VMT85_01185 [Thermoanaerobaculia bacterium]|nr:hypothetical protein [Thermoanaerobaculia bacterium]